VFGVGFVAELPRAILSLALNVGLWIVASNLLKNYSAEQSAKLRQMIADRKTSRQVGGEGVPTPAGD
jgi:hypothetical protein